MATVLRSVAGLFSFRCCSNKIKISSRVTEKCEREKREATGARGLSRKCFTTAIEERLEHFFNEVTRRSNSETEKKKKKRSRKQKQTLFQSRAYCSVQTFISHAQAHSPESELFPLSKKARAKRQRSKKEWQRPQRERSARPSTMTTNRRPRASRRRSLSARSRPGSSA